jgi:tetratricopeptide (TPR) repeat protein
MSIVIDVIGTLHLSRIFKPIKTYGLPYMFRVFTLLITCCALSAFGQQMTSKEWDRQALTNKRLLPKYGGVPRTEAEQKADQQFVRSALGLESSRDASNNLIAKGFLMLYSDIKTAMYRFNEAYLVDSTNPEIYWGYGAVYMNLGDYEKARTQYLQGLRADPANTHMLTDYSSYFLAQYYGLQSFSPKEASNNLDSSLSYLTKSYKLDPKDQNTVFKLSVSYLNKGDCGNAWKYYNACKGLGGIPITEEYTAELENKCRKP